MTYPGHGKYRRKRDDSRRLPGEFLMKGLLIAAGVVAILYVWDQQYEQGKYTYAVGRMVIQIRHSIGI
jgi:hypothetical protein